MDGVGWAKEQMVGEGEGGGTEVGMLNKRKLKKNRRKMSGNPGFGLLKTVFRELMV